MKNEIWLGVCVSVDCGDLTRVEPGGRKSGGLGHFGHFGHFKIGFEFLGCPPKIFFPDLQKKILTFHNISPNQSVKVSKCPIPVNFQSKVIVERDGFEA